jgi:hypothetical protein
MFGRSYTAEAGARDIARKGDLAKNLWVEASFPNPRNVSVEFS